MMVILIAVCVRAWRRQPGHPYVLMVIASTAIVWQDPIMNWAPYAVYNPQLWHWPEDWPLVKLSPTVEPFVVIGYATFYFVPPSSRPWRSCAGSRRARRRLVRLAPPAVSLACCSSSSGSCSTRSSRSSCVRTGLYIYSQVIPWGSLFAGTTFQFPLIWESSLVTVVMIPAGVLCYRDDTGRTQAEKLVQRFRWFPNRPALGTFLMMFAILNVAYFMYGGAFAVIRASGLATSVACPYPFPEAKVYDPQGFFEREGQPGPYFEGFWNTWVTAQPDGRPTVNPVKADGTVQAGPCLSRGASSSRVRRAGSASRPPHISKARLARRRSDALGRSGARAPARGDRRFGRRSAAARRETRPRRSASIDAAAKAIEDAVGAPDVARAQRRHRRRGAAEDMPASAWERLFRTNLFGPVALTRALLPSMRAAGRGRIVVVSSQGAVRGMPAISAYSASKGAIERWAESLAAEIAPFGLGVTILVSGTSRPTSSSQTPDYGDTTGRTRSTTRASIAGSWSTPRTRPSASRARSPRRSTSAHRSRATRSGSTLACCCWAIACCRAGFCII